MDISMRSSFGFHDYLWGLLPLVMKRFTYKLNPSNPYWLPWVSEIRSGWEPRAAGGELLRGGGPGRSPRRRRGIGFPRRLQRDGYRFGTDDLLARLNDGVHWLGVTRDGLRKVIARAGSIGYVVDNAGEFQFDKALIKRLAELGREVVVLCQVRAVRGGRYRGVRH